MDLPMFELRPGSDEEEFTRALASIRDDRYCPTCRYLLCGREIERLRADVFCPRCKKERVRDFLKVTGFL